MGRTAATRAVEGSITNTLGDEKLMFHTKKKRLENAFNQAGTWETFFGGPIKKHIRAAVSAHGMAVALKP